MSFRVRRFGVLTLALGFSVAGCVSTNPVVRVSTAELKSDDAMEVTLAEPTAQVIETLKKLMDQRGLKVKAVAPTQTPDTAYYVFTGPRRVLSSGDTVASVGSWIAVRVEPHDQGTRLSFLGKPTIGGQELCSDADARLADAQYWCQDTRVDPKSTFARELTGREEVELITGLITELRAGSGS